MNFRLLCVFFMLPAFSYGGVMGSEPSHWQGLYAGGHFGAAWGLLRNNLFVVNNITNPLFYPPTLVGVNYAGSNTFNPLRFSVGVQGGYNREISPYFLAGLEISYHYLNLSEILHRVRPYANSPTLHFYSFKNFASATQMGTLRPRVGYHYADFLPYITGGGAVTNLNFNQTFVDQQYGATHFAHYQKSRYGWIAGAGIEYLPVNQVSYKLEYLYANFGNVNVTTPFLGTGPLIGLSAAMNNSLRNIVIQTLVLGLNFHFS